MKPFDQSAPRLEIIAGHEYEKRAVEIALIGNHPVCFLINKGSEIPSLLMTANRIALEHQIRFKGLAYFWCPCGNYGSPKDECLCKYPVIEKHLRKLAKQVSVYDIWGQSNAYPRQFHLGEVEEEFVARVKKARELRKAAEKELKKSDIPPIQPNSPSTELIRYYQISISDKLDVPKVIRLAQTIAYSDHEIRIQKHHLQEALQYQPYTMAGLQGILKDLAGAAG